MKGCAGPTDTLSSDLSFTPRDCDLLDGPGDSGGRGDVSGFRWSSACHVLLVVLHGGYLLDDGRDQEQGAVCADLGSTEVERVQVVL